jgi:hypothetical protein
MVPLSPWSLIGTSLAGHIGHVVVVRAQEKMVWVDAPRHVALVKDMQALGNRALGFCPRESVRAMAAL